MRNAEVIKNPHEIGFMVNDDDAGSDATKQEVDVDWKTAAHRRGEGGESSRRELPIME